MGYVASAIDLPLLSDADTGYGNALNVYKNHANKCINIHIITPFWFAML